MYPILVVRRIGKGLRAYDARVQEAGNGGEGDGPAAVEKREKWLFHRRFSEFCVLEKALKAELPQLIPFPPLPPKDLLNVTSPVFIQRRREHLQEWLRCLLRRTDVMLSKVCLCCCCCCREFCYTLCMFRCCIVTHHICTLTTARA